MQSPVSAVCGLHGSFPVAIRLLVSRHPELMPVCLACLMLRLKPPAMFVGALLGVKGNFVSGRDSLGWHLSFQLPSKGASRSNQRLSCCSRKLLCSATET